MAIPISPTQLGVRQDKKAAAKPAVDAAQNNAFQARQPSGRAIARPGPNSVFMARAARAQGQPVNPMDLDPETQRVVPYSETLAKQQAQVKQQQSERMARSPNGGMTVATPGHPSQPKILGVDPIQAQQQQEANDAPRDAYMKYAGQKLREQNAPKVPVEPAPVVQTDAPGNAAMRSMGIAPAGEGVPPTPVAVRTPAVSAPVAAAPVVAAAAPPDDLMRRATALQNAAKILKVGPGNAPAKPAPVAAVPEAPPKRSVSLGPDSSLTPEQQQQNNTNFADQQSAIFKGNTPEGKKQFQGLSSVMNIPLPNPGGISAPQTPIADGVKKKKSEEDDEWATNPANPDTDV
jgi:hypothetical protein